MPPSSGSAGAVSDPVFVDWSGRRGRLVKRTGVVVSLLGLAYGVALVSLALIGVHINAAGLPLLEKSVRTVNGRAALHRTVGRPATVTNRPKATPKKSTDQTLQTAAGNGAASGAGQPRPGQIAASARADSQKAHRASAAGNPEAAAVAPVAPAPVAPASAPPSSAATSSAAPSSAAPSPTAPSPTADLSPVTTRGKSAAAPGATRRATPANQSKSTRATAASDRPTDPSQGKSAGAPGASRRPTDP